MKTSSTITQHENPTHNPITFHEQISIIYPEAEHLRSNADLSFLFDVPTDWVRAGNLNFFFTVNPDRSVPETDANWNEDNTIQSSLNCVAKQRPGLVFAPISSQIGSYQPGGPGFWEIVTRGESLLPVNGFETWFRGGELTKPVLRARFGIPPWEIVGRHFEMPGDQKAALLWLAVARVMDKRPSGAPDDLHWVGMFPRGIPSFNGLGGIANRPLSELIPDLPGILEPVVGNFVMPPNAHAYSLIMRMEDQKESLLHPDWFSPRGGITLAHELAHNYGRFHIPYGIIQFPEGPYDSLPFPLSNFGPVDVNNPANIMGFDWFTNSEISPFEGGDLMSYAERRWPSRETYLALMNIIPNATPAAPLGHDHEDHDETPAVMVVQGSVDHALSVGALGPIYRLGQGEADPATFARFDEITTALDGVFSLRLRALNESGAVLAEFPMIPMRGHAEEGPGGDQHFVAMFPNTPGTAKLEMVRANGNVRMAQLEPSFSTPTVQVGAVTLDEDLVEVDWIAEDGDGDPLLAAVQFTPDGGDSWLTLTANAAGGSFVTPTASLPGGPAPRFRVIVSDGFSSAQADSRLLDPIPNRTPKLSIVGLNEGDRMSPGEVRTLSGAAWDPEDGRIEELTWVLGGANRQLEQSWTGSSLLLEGLAPGAYALNLYAPDSEGLTGITTVNFEVLPFGVPESAQAPEIDGLCGDPAYADGTVAVLPNDDSTAAEVILLRHGGSFYACFTGLRYGIGGSTGATAGIQFDTDAGGGTTAQLGDVGFFIDENGVPWQSEGNGANMLVREVPVGGVELAVVRGPETWSAEFRIPNGLLGGAAGAANFLVCHDNVEGPGTYRTWPSGAMPNEPGTWAGGAFGEPDPPANGPPVADAGFNRALVVSAGDLITLDGLASHDPDGDALSYSWQQIAGQTVVLDRSTSATPHFVAPAPPTELRFSLTVNDGTENGAVASEVSIALLSPNPLPLDLPPTLSRKSEGFLITILRDAQPGACYEIGISEDLQHWRAGGTVAANLFGLVSYHDTEGVPPEGHRFYRARSCSQFPGFALSFIGDGSVASVPHNPALNSYPMTLSLWFRTTNIESVLRGVVSKYADGSFNGYSLFLYEGVLWAWYFNPAGGSIYQPATNTGVWGGFVADGEWHHVAFIVDEAGGALYVDGTINHSLPWGGAPGVPTNEQPLQLGRYANYTSSMAGEIDEVGLWGRALNPAEINVLKNTGTWPAGGSPVSFWRCDEGGGTQIIDSTTNGHTGILKGPVSYVPR